MYFALVIENKNSVFGVKLKMLGSLKMSASFKKYYVQQEHELLIYW